MILACQMLLAALPLLSIICGRPAPSSNSSPNLEVSNLKIDAGKGVNTTISFEVYDPNPDTNSTTTCTADWKTGGTAYPTGSYTACTNSSFAWNFVHFNSSNFQSFVLGIEHNYEYAAIGPQPYDYIDYFANAIFNHTDMLCAGVSTMEKCNQYNNTVVQAPIYASVAKK